MGYCVRTTKRAEIEKAMREERYGVNGTVKPYRLSMFKLIKLLLTQQAILNDHKITDLERKNEGVDAT